MNPVVCVLSWKPQDIQGVARAVDRKNGYLDPATGLPMIQNYTACA